MARGRDIGLVRQIFSAIGFFSGLLIGSLLSPRIVNLVHTTSNRLMITLAITLGFAIIFLLLGETVGDIVKNHLTKKIISKIDAYTGAVLGGIMLLASVWLLTTIIISLPFTQITSNLKDSYIINKLDEELPPAPSVIAKLSYFIDPNGFPRVFLGAEPTPPDSVVAPEITGKLKQAVEADQKSVVKIEGLGCGGIVEGSGFVVGQGLVATNAHVVAGIAVPYVVDNTGEYKASAIWFDPSLDLAILKTPNLTEPALKISPNTPANNAVGAVMGYPGGGNQEADGAVVLNNFTAIGRDIYNSGTTERHILELKAKIVPGNSGGPLIDQEGEVIGVVFAKSTSFNKVGYALTTNKVISAINQAKDHQVATSTGTCAD